MQWKRTAHHPRSGSKGVWRSGQRLQSGRTETFGKHQRIIYYISRFIWLCNIMPFRKWLQYVLWNHSPLLQNMDPPLHHLAHFCNKWTTGILQEQGSANQKFRPKVSNGFIDCLSHYVYSSIFWSTSNLDTPPPPKKEQKLSRACVCVCVWHFMYFYILFHVKLQLIEC